MARSSRSIGLLPSILMILCLNFIPSSLAQNCSTNDLSSRTNTVYATCSTLPSLSSYLYWTYDESNKTANIAFRKTSASSGNWVAWALNPTSKGMIGSQALVAYRHSNGTVLAYTSPVTGYGTQLQEGTLSFGVSNISANYSNNEMVIYATLQLDSSLVSTNQLWQEGTVSGDVPQAHAMGSANKGAVGTIDFQSGTTTVGGGSGSKTKRKNVHGVLNAVSWGTLMPMGVIMARYLKVFKAANPVWFYMHVGTQATAYGIGVAGWATGIALGDDSPGTTKTKHRNIGVTLFVFGTLQVFALLLRPKPDHKYRFHWNIYHHTIGYSTIILSIINIYEGFDILDPEKKWKKIYTGILIFLGAVALVLEAVTWMIVIKRKKSNKTSNHMNGVNGVNGHGVNGHGVNGHV